MLKISSFDVWDLQLDSRNSNQKYMAEARL